MSYLFRDLWPAAYWLDLQDSDGNHQLPEEDVTAIKREIIGLMITVPANIQSQLGDAVGVIADSDFWRRWDTLVDVSQAPTNLGFLSLY